MAVKKPITHPNPAVSVVIPTIPEYELKALSTLQKQTEEQFEVVVVSDVSLNRCEARNKGIKEANAEIVAQTDDDCYVPSDWVERIRRFFEQNPNKVLIEGIIDKCPLPSRHYIGANMAYRRDAALAIDGFNSQFAGWRADTDFGWRIEIEFGEDQCYYYPELGVIHDGPLRTTVDRVKEKRLRQRYPRRYFTILWKSNVPFKYQCSMMIALCYLISNILGECIFQMIYLIRGVASR